MKNAQATASTAEQVQNENATTKATRKQLLVITRPLTGNLSRGYSLALISDGKRHDLGEMELSVYASGAKIKSEDRRTSRGLSILEVLAVGADMVAANGATLRAGYLVKHFGGVAAYATKQRAKLREDRRAALKEVADARARLSAGVLLGVDKTALASLEQAATVAAENAKPVISKISASLAKIDRDERALVAYVALNQHLLTDAANEENENENAKTRAEMRKRCNGAEDEIKKRREMFAQAEREEKRDPATAMSINERKQAQRKTARRINSKRNA